MSAHPWLVKGVLYLSTPSSRVIALEAETGTEIWQFDPEQVTPEKPFYVQHRGVSFWQGEVDGKKQRRILIGTGDARLIALDAETGRPFPDFGKGGEVDLFTAVADQWPGTIYTVTSAPAIYRNVVMVGARLSAAGPRGPSGKVRAFDVISGEQLWEFHTVPLPGQKGNETWEGELLEGSLRGQRLVHHQRGRGAGMGLSSHRFPTGTRAGRSEPLRQLAGGSRGRDGPAGLALSDGPPRSLGL